MTPVYTCLLDSNKAFDRVNHWTLVAKLIETGAPLLIVRFLLFWYQKQQVCIKWGNSCSVCAVFKPKVYKLYFPTVFIGSDALKFIKESKYLGFTFDDSKSDDCDMLRQMRLLYAKSNKLLRTFSHCSTDVKITLFQSYCTALYCPYLWNNYNKSIFRTVHVAFNNAYRKIFGYLSGVVPVRCMQTTISATLKQL